MSIILLLSLLAVAFGVEILHLEEPHVEDEYVITYYTNTTHTQANQHWALMESFGVAMKFKYASGSHTGFSAKITDKKVLSALQEDPLVEFIEANGFAYAIQTCENKQSAATWGLRRTSHIGDIGGGLSSSYDYKSSANGKGVSVYVLDTGIRRTHTDFGGRVATGISFIPGETTDGNGHGTHCAGTIGGTLYGIAKQSTLVPVKVLSNAGSGSWDQVIAGVDWVTDNGVSGSSVASMSLGGTGSFAALTSAINALVGSGIPCVVAAGNNNGASACGYTPAGIDSVICVGASEMGGTAPSEYDARASFSNIGPCVDLFAPGRNILSAWFRDDSSTNIISGTSMACPHVAGVVAGILSERPGTDPETIKSMLAESAQKNLISNVGTGSPNSLLYNGCATL